MTQWYVKELSKLTNVSVRTLHHYDKIGLLKPSIRLENNYRSYSEKDLLKLQQIIALKFFGFELSRIKTLMQEEIPMFDHFGAQKDFLEKQVKSLQAATRTIDAILSKSSSSKSVQWKTILKLIEVYQMTTELKNTWVVNALNPSELKDYSSFEKDLYARHTEAEASASRQKWLNLVKDVEANLDKDPKSDIGAEIGRRCMEWTNAVFPKKDAALKKAIWEKGFKGGHSEVPPAVVTWLDQATSEYWRRRVYGVLDQVGNTPQDALRKAWDDLLTEICGDDPGHKQSVIEAVVADQKISQIAKEWVKK